MIPEKSKSKKRKDKIKQMEVFDHGKMFNRPGKIWAAGTFNHGSTRAVVRLASRYV